MRVRGTLSVAIFLAACLLWARIGEARQIDYRTARLERTLPAVRATGPIKVDGALDEPDWSGAPVARGFIQNEPHEGEPASDDTDVRVLYDANKRSPDGCANSFRT